MCYDVLKTMMREKKRPSQPSKCHFSPERTGFTLNNCSKQIFRRGLRWFLYLTLIVIPLSGSAQTGDRPITSSMDKTEKIKAEGNNDATIQNLYNNKEININAIDRQSVFIDKWLGYDKSKDAFLSKDYDHYLKFDLNVLRNLNGIVVDDAFLTLKGGIPHIRKGDGPWDADVVLYRAIRFNVSGLPATYDENQAFATCANRENADLIFNITQLVRGWIKGSWPNDDIGCIALHCPGSSYIFSKGDFDGAVLTVKYHIDNSTQVFSNESIDNVNNIFLNKHVISSTSLSEDSQSSHATDGIFKESLIFANDDISQRLAISGFNSPLKEVHFWDFDFDFRTPRTVALRSSQKDLSSLNPDDYENDLGQFRLRYRRENTKLTGIVNVVCLSINAPEGTKSLYADFGPSRAQTKGIEGMGVRICEIQAFADSANAMKPLSPLQLTAAPEKSNEMVRFNISSLDMKSDFARKLFEDYPDLRIIGGYGYNPSEFYVPNQVLPYKQDGSGAPLIQHPWLLPDKDASRIFVTGNDGKTVDPKNFTSTLSPYQSTRVVAFQSPALMRAWEFLLPLYKAIGYEGLMLADHHYPLAPFGYAPAGYSEIEIESFRSDLAGRDTGLEVYDEKGGVVRWFLWDYFKFYYGFTWTPNDLGFENWDVYLPYQGNWNSKVTADNRQQLLYYVLLRYETLKFDSRLGSACRKNGLKYFPLYFSEAPWHGLDRLVGLRTVGLDVWGHEQFTQTTNTWENEQDNTLEIPYSYWGNLYKNNKFSRNNLGLVIEVSHHGTQKYPYWSSSFTFACTLDLVMAGNIKDIDMDFFPTCDQKSDEWLFKVAGYRAALEAASFTSMEGKPFPNLTRKILVIGERGIDRKDYPFTPNGLRNNNKISFVGNEMGSFPWLLSRMGYEFDFCDITLEGVDLEKYLVIVYDSRNLPDGMFETLQKWLVVNDGSSKRLITYGALPTRKISDPRWDAGNPSTIKSNGLKIVDPAAGLPLGIKRISPGETIALPIKSTRDTSGLTFDLDQLKSALTETTPTYTSEGLFPELQSGSQAVLSSLPMGVSGKLLYINYDFGRPSNYGFDAPVLEAVLNDSGIESIFSAKSDENMSVHCYRVNGEPETMIIIVKNRSRIEREIANNVSAGNKMTFLLGPDKGYAAAVSLKRWTQGKLVAFSFNRNDTWDISEKSNDVTLNLQDQMSDVFIVKSAESKSKTLDHLKRARNRMNEFMGDDFDRMLLKKYDR